MLGTTPRREVARLPTGHHERPLGHSLAYLVVARVGYPGTPPHKHPRYFVDRVWATAAAIARRQRGEQAAALK